MPGGTTSVRRPARWHCNWRMAWRLRGCPAIGARVSCRSLPARCSQPSDEKNAERFLQRAAQEYDKVERVPSVQMSDFINARARLGDPTAHDDLQKLVSAWQKVNPSSNWHGEALYWLSRVQEANGQAGPAAQTKQQAVQILKHSKLPALRLLAS